MFRKLILTLVLFRCCVALGDTQTEVFFADDFEQHETGERLADVKPAVGGEFGSESTSTIVSPGTAATTPATGSRYVELRPGADLLVLSSTAQQAVRRKTVRFDFDLFIPHGDGNRGADIQTFVARPHQGRAFNLLLHNDGRIRYHAGDSQSVEGRFSTDRWIPVSIVADYARHVFQATVDKITFAGRFDTRAETFEHLFFGEFGDPTYFYDNVRVVAAPGEANSIPVRPNVSDYAVPRQSPFEIGDRAQLFVDQMLVHDSHNVAFSLHPGRKHPQNPLLLPDRPWEGWRLEIYGSVIYDDEEQLFKMWYIGESPEDFPHYATFYATSHDGVRWEKPLIGTVESRRGGKHNAVAEGYLLASVIKDRTDPDPGRRYKMICWRQKPPHGAQSMVSPDGLHWTQVSDQPICRSSDVITGFYDRSRKVFVAFPKLNTVVRGHARRCFGLTLSSDFLNWSESQLVLAPDARDDAGSLARIERVRHRLDRPDDSSLMRTEFYGVGAYQHESCTLVFPWVLTINNNARYGNHEGPAEIQLASSRDLVHWDRPFRTPVIPINEPNAWDESYQQTSAEAIRVGDEIWLYYCGANYTHGTPVLYRTQFEDGRETGRKTLYTGGIGLVKWPLDRFVSVDGPSNGGSLTTVPVRFQGDRLELNIAVAPGGEAAVEILDPAGQPLAGYERSDPITGDGLRTTVTFRGDSAMSKVSGKPVVLRFQLRDASLYSYAFRR